MIENKKTVTDEEKKKEQDDAVDEASRESFPASDAPSWTGVEVKIKK